jgi:16S rRNA (guanine966-N2)-methyltransferase
VREATFNALGSLGVIEGATVLDLFAGSGAMGIEALSRGASAATFVDSDRGAVEAIRTNLDATRLAAAATVVRGDVARFLAAATMAFDVAVVDPPYAFDGWGELLSVLAVPIVVIESDREIEPGAEWAVVRSRRYGSTVVTISGRPDHEETSP